MLDSPLMIKEGWAHIDESARITGIALVPRISRNGNLYTKEELKRFNNVKVPLNWEHDPSKVIGSVTFFYNSETEQVFYEGNVDDDAAAALVKNKTLFTSIEASPVDVKSVCNGPGDCFSMPFGLTPTALALTETPGVPETSVNVIESMIKECFHDQELEDKYAPGQKNLQNEKHIHNLLHEVGDPGADDQCISAKMSKLDDENPGMDHDQKVAIAISMCSTKESIKMMLNHNLEEYFCKDCGELKKNVTENTKSDIRWMAKASTGPSNDATAGFKVLLRDN